MMTTSISTTITTKFLFFLALQTAVTATAEDCQSSDGSGTIEGRTIFCGSNECSGTLSDITTITGCTNVYCIGSDSCQYALVEEYSQTTVSCSGTFSCLNLEVDKLLGEGGIVDCTGSESCHYLDVQAAENPGVDQDIYCGGYDSCLYATIKDYWVGNIECFGPNSCTLLSTPKLKGSMDCLGDDSCLQVTLSTQTTGIVNCIGTMSCNYLVVEDGKQVDCQGTNSCEQATLEVNTLKCLGEESCTDLDEDSVIGTQTCTGENSCLST